MPRDRAALVEEMAISIFAGDAEDEPLEGDRPPCEQVKWAQRQWMNLQNFQHERYRYMAHAALAVAEAALRADEREACVKVVEAQPYYPDTHTGMRQQWVKDQIATAIRARGEREDGDANP